jgi:hypothetical protein
MSTWEIPGHALAGALLLVAQLSGAPPGGSPAEEIERSVTRPVPQAPTVPVEPSPNVWVPDRYLADPGRGGTSFVPGHWERRLSDGEYYAPPTTACNSASGECSTAPAGVRPPPDKRVAPWDPRIAP